MGSLHCNRNLCLASLFLLSLPASALPGAGSSSKSAPPAIFGTLTGQTQCHRLLRNRSSRRRGGGPGMSLRLWEGEGCSSGRDPRLPDVCPNCGRCTPCKPVHVPVPPGTPVTAEYYPEAWRCKCGNGLFMP